MSTPFSVSFIFSDDNKQDDSTNDAHSKRLIELLKGQKVLTSALSTIWENTDGRAEQYRRASELYLMSFFSQYFSIIIDRGIISPGHGKEVVDGLNVTEKRYI